MTANGTYVRVVDLIRHLEANRATWADAQERRRLHPDPAKTPEQNRIGDAIGRAHISELDENIETLRKLLR